MINNEHLDGAAAATALDGPDTDSIRPEDSPPCDLPDDLLPYYWDRDSKQDWRVAAREAAEMNRRCGLLPIDWDSKERILLAELIRRRVLDCTGNNVGAIIDDLLDNDNPFAAMLIPVADSALRYLETERSAVVWIEQQDIFLTYCQDVTRWVYQLLNQ